jgi:alkylation response protein AidB-like acyl-CoA dehydrogenase
VTVDVDLTDDQELMARTTARFIESSCPVEKVRTLGAEHADAGADYRRQAAELGWYAMLVPDDLGGGSVSDNGVFDAAVVAYERGRFLQPGAFVATNAVACGLAASGSEAQRAAVLPALVAGEAVATWALATVNGSWEPGQGLRVEARGDGYVLSGAAGFVQDADLADWLLVTAGGDDGLTQLLVEAGTPGVDVRLLDGLDLTRRFCEVTCDDVELPAAAVVGDRGSAADAVERQLQVAMALTAAESAGAMDRDFEAALDYAKARTAFGRPIGSFQAVKHLLADTSLLLEMSKAMATAAARAVGERRADAPEVARMAKAFVGDSGVELAQNCFQVFGGIGFTWEHDQHLYLRRITTDAALYGEPAYQREQICRHFDL